MLKKAAEEIIGGLSRPGKMPCPSYSIPATRCQIGAILAKTPGTICNKCYALKGRYVFPTVREALERRYKKLMLALNSTAYALQFIHAFQALLLNERYFRWHDSGDLQSLEHLDLICRIATATPDTLHWLPTREKGIVISYREVAPIPNNLIIRLSSSNIGQSPIKWRGLTSTVHMMEATAPIGEICLANARGGKCGPCRACWDKSIANVSYPFH